MLFHPSLSLLDGDLVQSGFLRHWNASIMICIEETETRATARAGKDAPTMNETQRKPIWTAAHARRSINFWRNMRRSPSPPKMKDNLTLHALSLLKNPLARMIHR